MRISDVSTFLTESSKVNIHHGFLVFLLLSIGATSASASRDTLLDHTRAAQLAASDELRIDTAASGASPAHSRLAARWEAHPSFAWTELALDGITKYRLNPLRAARLLAHLHAALHDAWVLCAPARDELRCARIAQHVAGARVLENFLPEEAPGRFIALATSALASLDLKPLDEPEREALQRGKSSAWAALLRAWSDASDRPLAAPQRPPPQPGTWRPTPPLFALNPTEGGAALWETWLLRNGAEVQPPEPLAYGSAAYVAEVREVLEVSRALTDAQKRVAEEWNLDVGTATPPGVWNRHATTFIRERGLGLGAATRLMTEVNLAMFDALVACWSAKLKWWTERPVTEVRERFDPGFVPHLTTPPFPGYVSGHACTSGAAAFVLGARIPELRDTANAMAAQAAMSRLYGGIHIRSDNEEGLKLGAEVARRAIERLDAGPTRRNQGTNK
jgi:hypothetical protein